MRAPVGWLAEYVDVPAGTTVEDLDTAFVRLGLEVEEIHRPEPVTGPLVIGRVLEIEELTGFKKPICYCQVDVGEAGPRGIVCGARNFAVGDAVVVALPGAVLPGGFEITARTTYDRVSDGMICSVRELGVGDDHAGILVLGSGREGVPRPGTPAGPVVGLDDVVIELAITPDRGYCLAMRGIAREMGTGLAAPWRDPGAVTPPAWSGEPAWQVTVADPERCDRFSMRAMEGLDPTAPSPWWMRRRLAQAGLRSISLAVDVTNYVMIELGQPMHAFDRDAVQGPITVRLAREGEKLTTLDGTVRKLSADDLLITDDSGPIGLAAVMGGASTEIGNDTTAVLLEAAHWDPAGVARTARRHRLPSEAAKRFERGVDPEMTLVALARAAELLSEHGGGQVVGGGVDIDTRLPRPSIPLEAARPAQVSGLPYTAAQVVELLEAVGCDVDAGSSPLAITPPSWRPDLTDPADLVEEVVRLAGYDDVPSGLPTGPPGRGPPGRAAPPRRGGAAPPTCSAADVAWAGRWPRTDTSRRRPIPSSGRRRSTRWACRTTTRAATSSSSATRCRRRSPACGRRCCPGCSRRWRATSPAASATWRCSSTGPCSPAASARRRRCPASTVVPTTRRWPRSWAPYRSSPGTLPSRSPATGSRAAGGVRAARPAGRTRSRPRGAWLPPRAWS